MQIYSLFETFFGLYGLEGQTRPRSNQSFANPFPEFLTPIDQSQAKTLYILFSIQDHNKAMEAAQQQKAAAAANGGRAASGQPQMRDSPNDNRGGNFFNMSMESDKNIST